MNPFSTSTVSPAPVLPAPPAAEETGAPADGSAFSGLLSGEILAALGDASDGGDEGSAGAPKRDAETQPCPAAPGVVPSAADFLVPINFLSVSDTSMLASFSPTAAEDDGGSPEAASGECKAPEWAATRLSPQTSATAQTPQSGVAGSKRFELASVRLTAEQPTTVAAETVAATAESTPGGDAPLSQEKPQRTSAPNEQPAPVSPSYSSARAGHAQRRATGETVESTATMRSAGMADEIPLPAASTPAGHPLQAGLTTAAVPADGSKALPLSVVDGSDSITGSNPDGWSGLQGLRPAAEPVAAVSSKPVGPVSPAPAAEATGSSPPAANEPPQPPVPVEARAGEIVIRVPEDSSISFSTSASAMSAAPPSGLLSETDMVSPAPKGRRTDPSVGGTSSASETDDSSATATVSEAAAEGPRRKEGSEAVREGEAATNRPVRRPSVVRRVAAAGQTTPSSEERTPSDPTPVRNDAAKSQGTGVIVSDTSGLRSEDEQVSVTARPPAVAGLAGVSRASESVQRPETSAVPRGIPGHTLSRVEHFQKLVDQLDRYILSASDGGEKTMTVTLIPENLGKVVMSCREQAGQLWVELQASNSSVRDVLQRQEESIRQMMDQSGLKLMQFDVRSQTGEGGARQFQRFVRDEEEQAGGEGRARPVRASAEPEPVAVASPTAARKGLWVVA